MRPQHMLLAALLCAAGIASADPLLPAGSASANTAAIQAAIDAAGNGGTVTLGAGLFEIDSQLMVTNGVALAGQGWENTVIRQVATTYSENTRVVTVSGGAKVERVTLTGGRLAGTNDKSGGGAYVSDGTLSWCCITNNSVSTANVKYGGGVGFSHGAGGQVDHCVIADNSASTSTGNEVGGGGIGAYQPLGPITIDSCLISGNRAIRTTGFGKGGGIAIEFIYQQVPVVVRNTTIVGNAAGEGETASKGGAVFTNNDSGKKFAMLDCVVAGNTTAGAATTVSLNYDGGVDYCFFDVEADKVGSNSLYGDPQFVDAADGDYRLSATSPAREAGVAYDGIGVDLDGVDFGVPPSMGCYEAGGVAKVKSPAFFPASGTRFYPSTNVTISCETDGAAIYYTLDGSEPTDSSTLYEGPIALSATTTVKARAYKQEDASDIVSATYTYEEPPPGIRPGATPAETRWTIQAAIDAAAPTHGTVTLGKGIFEIDAQLMVTSGVTLVGQGWEDTVIRQTAYGRDTRVATVDGGASVERVTLTGGNIAQVTLNGKASANWKNGAGAYVADGTISWCCISNNVSRGGNDNYGGGVFILKGRIDHSVVADNRVSTTTGIQAFGGGIAARHLAGPVVIESCLVRGNGVVNNAKAGFGGGIAVEYLSNDRYTSISVRNTTIVGNSAGEDGGSVAAKGGAVFTTVNSQPDGLNGFSMIDCIVAGNTTAVAEVSMDLSDARAVDWCLFDVAADAIGANSLVGDPAFVGAADDDYRLTLESPAVGSGESYEGLGTDLAGADFSDPPSMGCYEYGDLAAKPVFDPESGTEFILSTNVAIACATTGATIYYTTDGSRPTTSSAVYNGPITVSERTTIKARAFAEGVGPSAIATAVFSDGTIPLEPIVLGEPVSRPGRDFNGSVVTVDFTGDVPEGAEPTAKVTIDGVDYPGTVDAEHGTVTIVVPATAVTAGNTYSATVTLTVDGVDYTRTTTLEQGRPVIDEAQDWIYETASTFGETGAWSGEKALVAGEAIAVSNATFTAATAAPSNAVVTIRSTFSFGDASDDAFETSSRAGITVVPVDGVARYAVLTADGAATNLSVVANTASAVAVEIRIDGAANTVAYSVDGVSLGSYPMAAKEDGVSTMHYDGATAVAVLEGSYYLDWLDTNVARAGDAEYPTVEEAVRSGKEPVELLWDASWDPTTPGSYTITTNGYDLAIGGDLSSSVVDNGDGTITVTVTDDTVHVRANSITVGATTVLVGVEGIKAGHWYALEKTTDLAQDFVLDDSTWTSAADLLAGTGELEIALGEDEPCAFYQIRESETAPAVP